MRLSAPRIPPVTLEEYRAIQESVMGTTPNPDAPVLNISRTWAHHPALMKARAPLVRHLVAESSLPPRERELAILRVGWLCQAEYEFSQHTVFGKQAGLTDDEIRRVTEGPDAPGWTPFEASLLRAVDELHNEAFIQDSTWAALAERYSTQQLLDFICLVGQYTTVSMMLNTVGVQLEEGKPRFPR